LVARSNSAVRGLYVRQNQAENYLTSIGQSVTVPSKANYTIGFESLTLNTTSHWVDLRVCRP
jgi:hypothetical protein